MRNNYKRSAYADNAHKRAMLPNVAYKAVRSVGKVGEGILKGIAKAVKVWTVPARGGW